MAGLASYAQVGNTATNNQYGDLNTTVIFQQGLGHEATVTQGDAMNVGTGKLNLTNVGQYGVNMATTVLQTGDLNEAQVLQGAGSAQNDQSSYVKQTGNNNFAEITQDGQDNLGDGVDFL